MGILREDMADPTSPRRGDESDERVFFSLDEANRLVPELAERFEAVFARIGRVREITAHLSSLGGAYPGKLRFELTDLHRDMQSQLEAVQGMGCVVKDLQKGLVDFWHRRGGEDVFLCWRYGEASVEWFHDPTEGFAGRKRLTTPAETDGTPPGGSFH